MNIENIETKVDTLEKLAFALGKPTNEFLFASEVNAIVDAVKKNKIIELGEFIVYRRNIPPVIIKGSDPVFPQPIVNSQNIQIGDFVKGIVENIYIEALYIGGDLTQQTSFNIYNQTEFE